MAPGSEKTETMNHEPRVGHASGHIVRMTEARWRIAIVALSFLVTLVAVGCLSQGVTIIFMHLYYLPIVLLAYHYRRQGLAGILLLALSYLGLVIAFDPGDPAVIEGAVIRVLVFIGIGGLVIYLSEHLVETAERLRKTLQVQQSILQNANVWLMILDKEGRVLEWNTAAEKMSGYPASEVQGKNDIWRLLYPDRDYRKEITATINEIIATKKILENFSTTIRQKDGSSRTILWNTREVPHENGNSPLFIAIGVDITGQRRREEDLHLQATRFQKLLDLNRLKDAPFKEQLSLSLEASLDVTKSIYSFIGLISPDESVMTIHSWSKGAMKDCAVSDKPMHYPLSSAGVWGECIRQRAPFVLNEYTSAHPAKHGYPDGHVPITRYLGVPIFDGGSIVAVIAVANKQDPYDEGDINALTAIGNQMWEQLHRRQAEEMLREHERILNEVGRLAKVGGLELDIGTRTVKWTRETATLHDLPPDTDHLDLAEGLLFFDQPGRFILSAAITRCMETGEPFDFELPFTSAKGRHLWTRIMGRAVTEEGKVVSLIGAIQDITDLKQARKALEQSEEKFRGVAERSSDLILITDQSGTAIYASPATEKILGYHPEEVTGRTAFDFVLPESHEAVRETMSKNLGGHTVEDLKVRVRKKDGSYVLLQCSVSPVIKDGSVTGIQVIGRDVTEQRAAQEHIAKLLKVLREQVRIINTSPVVAFLWKAEEGWPVETVSENITQFGYTPDDFLSGRVSYVALIHPDDLDWVSAEVTYNSGHGIDEFTQQYRILAKDGKEHWIDDYTHIRRGNDGTITHYEGLILDITRRKRAEDALRKSEQRNARLIEAVPDLMFTISRDGVYLDFHVPDRSVLAIPADQILGRNIRDTGFSQEMTELMMERIALAIDTQELQQFEYDLTLQGVLRHYEARMVALDQNEVLAIVRDVTKQKQAEALQKHFMEELEQQVVARTKALNASLNEKVLLLREVHHRVKNNLQIIISLMNLQMRKAEDPRLKEILLETQDRVRAMSLVHEKLYVSEDLSRISLSTYLHSLCTQLISSHGDIARKVTLHMEFDPIMTDINVAIPFGLIINELVSNALKHAFPGEMKGVITLCGRVENGGIVVSVEDDGIGFPEGFDWRDSPTLGLHLVPTLVRQLNGRIDQVNKEKGTLFRVVIPGDMTGEAA